MDRIKIPEYSSSITSQLHIFSATYTYKMKNCSTFVKLIWFYENGHYINAAIVEVFKVLQYYSCKGEHFSFEETSTLDTMMIMGVNKTVHLFHTFAAMHCIFSSYTTRGRHGNLSKFFPL